MKSDARWMRILAGRVLANAWTGGCAFARVGAICGLIVGGFIFYLVSVEAQIQVRLFWTVVGAIYGILFGLISGIAGAPIYAIAAAQTKPGKALEPFHSLKKRVAWGQLGGTLCACTAFLTFELIKTQWLSLPLASSAENDASAFIFGAPILMICGAIAAALTKRDSPKVATLKAE